jgi:methionine-rich copper-binding protein CopC
MNKPIALTLLLTISSFVLADSTMQSAIPADHAHVTVAPKTVTINFDEKFAVKGAIFKVYYLPMSSMMKNGKPLNPGQMDDVAEATMNKYLTLKTDSSSRVDAGLQKSTALTKKVVINLKPSLELGVYVTMWKLKAVDNDIVTGFMHFHYDAKK